MTAPPRRRRRLWGGVALAALAGLAAFVLSDRTGGSASTPAELVGKAAPGLRGTTLDGAGFDLADWRGQVVLVNVWGSWCAPCRDEMPLLASAFSSLQQRGLRMVGIDVKDTPDAARAFLRQYGGQNGAQDGGAPWPSVVDPDGVQAVDWGTYALPETYLVGRDGRIVAKSTGEVSAAWIDRAVVPLLAGGTP